MQNDEVVRRSFLKTATASAIAPFLLNVASVDRKNLVANGSLVGKAGMLPDGWKTVNPNPALAPEFKLATGPAGKTSLMASSRGRVECFGYAAHPVQLEAGKNFNDGIFEYRKEGKQIVGIGKFPGPKKATAAEVRLYFRFAAKGRVFWDEVRLEEAEAEPPRFVKIASREGELPKGRHSVLGKLAIGSGATKGGYCTSSGDVQRKESQFSRACRWTQRPASSDSRPPGKHAHVRLVLRTKRRLRVQHRFPLRPRWKANRHV